MDVNQLGQIARFKVFPEWRDPRYWLVLVFRTKRSMRLAFHRLNGTRDHDDRFGAIVMPQERIHVTRKGRCISDSSLGYVLFAQTQIDPETQCHEAVHMALGYMRRKHKSLRLGDENNKVEEDLAYFTGYCVTQLHRNIYRHHLYRGQ